MKRLKQLVQQWGPDLLVAIGGVAILCGIAQFSRPAALVLGGSVIAYAGLVLARKG